MSNAKYIFVSSAMQRREVFILRDRFVQKGCKGFKRFMFRMEEMQYMWNRRVSLGGLERHMEARDIFSQGGGRRRLRTRKWGVSSGADGISSLP